MSRRRKRKGPPLRLPRIEVELARYGADRIVIRVAPSELRNYVDAPPCPVCDGRGLLPPPEGERYGNRCLACEATGLDVAIHRVTS